MSMFDALPPQDQVALEAAALWWEKLRAEPATELSADFLQWISESRNARAMNAVRDAMAKLDGFGAAPRVLDMRRAALARLRNGDAGRARWRGVARIAAVLVLCAAGAGGFAYWHAVTPITYETGIGERQRIVLPDGSRISLDSASAVEVRYTKAFRGIKLDHGRARFDVAHDTTRPFTVAAGAETVVAVGTAFNVEKLGPKVLVTLIQGRVVIKNESGEHLAEAGRDRPAIRLAAGQQLAAAGDGAPVVRAANLDAATAWESGQLVFRGEALADAVRQVNRYTGNPVMVAPSAASIPISGVFNAGDVGSFVSAITGYFPVDATTDSENRITLQKRT